LRDPLEFIGAKRFKFCFCGQVESKKALQQLNEEKDALVAQLARRVEDLQAPTAQTRSRVGEYLESFIYYQQSQKARMCVCWAWLGF
jgi:hypothetical protein